MKKTQLILVSLFALAVFTCTSGVASAISISPKYVGNTMVDLSWTQYESTDFSKYELCRDGVPITTITDRTVTFYRDKGLTKGNTYGYGISVYDATGVLKATRTTSATTGEVHGTIIIDTTWTAASSPYTLTGSVDVRNGATLTIGSGVVVVSATYKAISVEEKGVLYADGASFYDVWIEVHDYTSIKNCFFEHARIKLHNLNNSIIAGNTVNRSGIKLYSSSNNVITDNTLSNNPYGIYLSSSSNNNITYNTISNSNMHGIYLGYSSNNNVITDNTISNNSDCGIYLYSSSNNVITDNTLLNNNYGIYLRSSSNNNVITDNTISNNDNNGIHLWYSSNNAITDNIVLNNDGDGIHLCGSYYNNSITDNTVSNNDGNGIHLCGSYYSVSNNNSITDNTVSNNSVGIRLSKSSNNTVTDNTVSNNSRYGIYMTKSSNNTLYNNYFNNPRNGYEYANGNNTLNITKTAGTNIVGVPYLGGNYWSNYKGTDLDSDGLGDTPYGVSFNRNWRDYHPLIEMPMEIEKIITLIASTEELPANGMNKSLITAIVTDQTGPVVGVKVSFSLDNTSLGKLEPLTAKTNESGIATSNFTAGTIPGVVNVTANESKTHASDSVKIILGMIKINHTSSTYQFIPTPCRNATINLQPSTLK
jgi:parallel beta-helix repeat protein